MTDIAALAAALIAAHETGAPVAPPARAMARADILAVQAAVSAALGEVAGFKVGQVANAPPILAPIHARYVTADGAARVVRERLGIELEVGFEVIRPLPAGAPPPARPQDVFRPCVVLELVETRLTAEAAEAPDLKFMDNQINGGLVIGGRRADWDGADFGAVNARLTAGGATVIDGPATIPGGSALANLELLLRHLGDHCGGLQVGQCVITGSLCGLPWFPAGTEIHGWIEGLGSVSVSLAPPPDRASGRA